MTEAATDQPTPATLPEPASELDTLRAEVDLLRRLLSAAEAARPEAVADDPGSSAGGASDAVAAEPALEKALPSDPAILRRRLAREMERRTKLAADLKAAQERVAGAAEIRKSYRTTVDRLRSQLVAAQAQGARALRWVSTDKLNETTDWPTVAPSPSPFVLRRRGRIKTLFLNSMGGSAARLVRGLMLHQDVEADCVIFAYYPRRHLVYPLETNVFGVFSHQELRDFMTWAVSEYDIIQSTTLPLAAGVGSCYDWLADVMGRRHMWRETGFVHHLLHREDILPLDNYQRELRTTEVPGPHRCAAKTFQFTDTHILTDPYVMFYSSPEKGAYFQGRDTHWLPSIRDADLFMPTERRPDGRVRIYVPYHRSAIWKGLQEIIAQLETIKAEGAPLDIITSDTAGQFFPDLVSFGGVSEVPTAYPIPNHMIPTLMSRVDVVIDQVLMGCYGNTGIEAMLAGVPVLGQRRYAEVADAPLWDITVDGFRTEFLRFLDSPEAWPELGRAGQEYARRVHSAQAVSGIAAESYRRVMDEAGAPRRVQQGSWSMSGAVRTAVSRLVPGRSKGSGP